MEFKGKEYCIQFNSLEFRNLNLNSIETWIVQILSNGTSFAQKQLIFSSIHCHQGCVVWSPSGIGGGGEDVPPFVASSHSVKNGHVPWRGCGHTSMQELSSYTPGLNTRNDVFPFLRTHREKEKELRETDNILVHFCCSRFPVQARRNLKPYCKRSA